MLRSKRTVLKVVFTSICVMALIMSLLNLIHAPDNTFSQNQTNNVHTRIANKLYVKTINRLGNLMFEYASLYGIATRLHRQPIFVPSHGAYKQFFKLFPKLGIAVQKKVDCKLSRKKGQIHLIQNSNNYHLRT